MSSGSSAPIEGRGVEVDGLVLESWGGVASWDELVGSCSAKGWWASGTGILTSNRLGEDMGFFSASSTHT